MRVTFSFCLTNITIDVFLTVIVYFSDASAWSLTLLWSSHSSHLQAQCLRLFSFPDSCRNSLCNSLRHSTCQISLSCFTQRRSLLTSHLSILASLLCHSYSGKIKVTSLSSQTKNVWLASLHSNLAHCSEFLFFVQIFDLTILNIAIFYQNCVQYYNFRARNLYSISIFAQKIFSRFQFLCQK